MEDRILELLKEIPEKEIPEEFERTLSFNLKKEAWAMKRHRRTKALAVMATSFLVVFGSISVYNDLGGFKMGGGSYDSASIEMYTEDKNAEDHGGIADMDDRGFDGGIGEDFDEDAGDVYGALQPMCKSKDLIEAENANGLGAFNYRALAPDHLALLNEYFAGLAGKDYKIKDCKEEADGDLVFYIEHEGEELVLIIRAGEIYDQKGKKQKTDSD